VKLHSVRLCNFRQHADTRIEFDAGLTGIIGPNGSGKTTILEGIAWALYGNSAARGTKESIRFSRAPAKAAVSVELDFDLAGHRYRVMRGLTSAALYLDGAEAPIANSISSVTELLQRRLGMTRGEFFNTYFTGQKELNAMAAMGPSERGKFLSRVLGYERLRVAQDLVKDRKKLLVAEIAGVEKTMPDRATVERDVAESAARLARAVERAEAAAARLDESRRSLEAAVPEWERAQRERDRWQELESERKLAEKDAGTLVENGARVARELAEVAKAREQLESLRRTLAPYAQLVEELRRAEALYREEGRRRTLVEIERALAEELVPLEERLAQLRTAPALEKTVEADLVARRAELADIDAKVTERHAAWQRELQEARTKLKFIGDGRRDLREQREQLLALGPDGKCPTCARPLDGDHLPSVLAELDEDAEKLDVDEKYYKDRVKQLTGLPPELAELQDARAKLTERVASLGRKLAKVQAAIQQLATLNGDVEAKRARQTQVAAELTAIPGGYDAAGHARLTREVARLQPLEAQATRLGGAVEREPQLERERARIAGELEAAIAVVTQLRARVGAIGFEEAKHERIRRRWEEARELVRTTELASVTARGEMATAQSAVVSAHAAREALGAAQVRLDDLQRRRRLHDELDRAYGDLRTDLNIHLRPEVSELASGFLAELTDGRYAELELDEQYNIIVLEDSVPKPVISGGEEDLANLVLRLAISQMIAERTGQSFTLLILDEVFGSLDESRRHHVVDLLRRLHDRFEQVIVITHIESVRDGLDRVLAVRYDEARGSSVVDAIAEDGTRMPVSTPGGDAGSDENVDLWAGAA
jgi:DNA repair protein SbcC/Rad50